VTSGTSQVDKTTLSKKDDMTAVLHQITVNLGLDILNALGILLQPGNIDLNVEVADVYAVSISLN
jgi:hypothetical protein